MLSISFTTILFYLGKFFFFIYIIIYYVPCKYVQWYHAQYIAVHFVIYCVNVLYIILPYTFFKIKYRQTNPSVQFFINHACINTYVTCIKVHACTELSRHSLSIK